MHHIQYITFISTTGSLAVDQNVRYHMHKYNITDNDWYRNNYVNVDHKCTGSVIR